MCIVLSQTFSIQRGKDNVTRFYAVFFTIRIIQVPLLYYAVLYSVQCTVNMFRYLNYDFGFTKILACAKNRWVVPWHHCVKQFDTFWCANNTTKSALHRHCHRWDRLGGVIDTVVSLIQYLDTVVSFTVYSTLTQWSPLYSTLTQWYPFQYTIPWHSGLLYTVPWHSGIHYSIQYLDTVISFIQYLDTVVSFIQYPDTVVSFIQYLDKVLKR